MNPICREVIFSILTHPSHAEAWLPLSLKKRGEQPFKAIFDSNSNAIDKVVKIGRAVGCFPPLFL